MISAVKYRCHQIMCFSRQVSSLQNTWGVVDHNVFDLDCIYYKKRSLCDIGSTRRCLEETAADRVAKFYACCFVPRHPISYFFQLDYFI